MGWPSAISYITFVHIIVHWFFKFFYWCQIGRGGDHIYIWSSPLPKTKKNCEMLLLTECDDLWIVETTAVLPLPACFLTWLVEFEPAIVMQKFYWVPALISTTEARVFLMQFCLGALRSQPAGQPCKNQWNSTFYILSKEIEEWEKSKKKKIIFK